ncbi:hypothetical protein [Streptomyces humidus]|uniref:hypothetical protein n=1 Tax=Streptomyces humidus TaxID=52259 RepID=UPI00332ED41A
MNPTGHRTVFGIPAVLTGPEISVIAEDLTALWKLTYGSPPKDLESDLELCRKFFDPLTRGGTLRERLASLEKTPMKIRRASYTRPLVIDVGSDSCIVGVEARLFLDLLQEVAEEDYFVLSPSSIAVMEGRALDKYREWSTARLNQVVALRSGKAIEVMQAISVGLVIALLVNRSDAPERAMPKLSMDSPEGRRLNSAIYSGAERFAEMVMRNKSSRSAGERSLKGGYGLSEARRRLAHRLVTDKRSGGEFVHVSPEHKEEVILYLAADLARRSSLTEDSLAGAFDALILGFRETGDALAHGSLIFERPADTRRLKTQFISAFAEARARNERESE